MMMMMMMIIIIIISPGLEAPAPLTT